MDRCGIGLAWTFFHGQSDCTEHNLRRDYHDHPVFSVRRDHRRVALETSAQNFGWALSIPAVISVLMNLIFRSLTSSDRAHSRNFITGHITHRSRKPLRAFVDIAGSTGPPVPARRGRHPSLSRSYVSSPNLSVVDYRGEVLNYVGDEVIVIRPERMVLSIAARCAASRRCAMS